MYKVDIEPIAAEIKKQKAKRVLLHLPDGLRPKADKIQTELKSKLGKDVDIYLWAGSCYGACDLPIESKNAGVDMIVHFGHTRWRTD